MEDIEIIAPPAAQELALFTTEEEKAIAAKLLPAVTARIANEIRGQLEAQNAQRLHQQMTDLMDANKRQLEDELQKIRDAAKPPEPKDIQKLLDQEYLEFTVKLRDELGQTVDFVIAELPNAAEKQLLRIIEKKIVPTLKQFSAADFSGTTEEKLNKILKALPDGLDTFAELCAKCLDPWNKKGITAEWVLNNLSAYRIVNILNAQLEAGRLRDFFSAVFRLIPGTNLV